MEKAIELIDLSYRSWVFLWDSNQEKAINFGQEALDWWEWYQQDQGNEHWQLVFPLKAGILQSKWALEQILKHEIAPNSSKSQKIKRIQVLLASANSQLEKEAIKRLVAQVFLRPTSTIDRGEFLNNYLKNKQDFSKLKLIIDLNLDFAELSLFLADKKLKTRHLALSKDLDEVILIERLKSAIDTFVLNVPINLFQQKWQYFYLFLHQDIKNSSLILEELSRHLKMEGILNQEPSTSYA
jgi:hypothetical protein